MDNSLKQQILNYELKTFDEYILKRNLLLDNINSIDFKNLNKEQLVNCVNDIKSIIDPVKLCCENIDFYFTNLDFKKTDSLKSILEVNNVLFYYNFILKDFLLTSTGLS